MLTGLTPEGRRFAVVLLAALAVYAAGTRGRVFAAGNDASRWAHIESLVDHGSASLERSRFRATVDRVALGGREYSNKPPLLALAGAALYAPLAASTGWRLGDPATAPRVIWLLTLLLTGVPAAAAVALFDRALARYPRLAPGRRSTLTLALAVGTLLLPFAVTLNNHAPAAALLLAATLAAFDGRGARAGLLAGLAGGIDLVPGFGFAPFLAAIVGLAALGSGRERALRRSLVGFAAGLAAATAIFVAGNLATTGSPLPPKLVPGAVDLAATAGASVAGVVLPQSAGYPLELLFGAHGLFTVSPILLVGAAGLALALLRPGFGDRRAWALVAAGVAAQFVAHALVAGSYGGWSYGYRYLLPVQPLLLLAAPPALERTALRVAAAALLPPSILFALLGAYHPWPPAFEQASHQHRVAALVRDPIGGNAAAWLEQHFPASAVATGVGSVFVSPDAAERRDYYRLFFASKGDLETMRRFETRESELRRRGP